MVDLHTDWKPEYAPWRHGGYYVTNVRYPDGAIGCISSNYPDGKWRITCDESLTPYPSRDAAARAERTLAYHQHLVAMRSAAATHALATVLRIAGTARRDAEHAVQQLECSPTEMRRFQDWVEAGRPDADDYACEPCSTAGQAWDCNRTLQRNRHVACDGPNLVPNPGDGNQC